MKRPPAPTVVAGDIPQAEPATAAGRGTEHAPTADNEPKVATSTIKNFADIEDTEGSAALAAVPGAIMLPALKQRQKANDDSYRLKRIMAICSGC